MAVRAVAATFGVSIAYIYKALMRRRLTGDAGINPNRGHNPRKLSGEQEQCWRLTCARDRGSCRRRRKPGCWPSMVCNSAPGRLGTRCIALACHSKKALRAAEQDRPDVAARRKLWRAAQPFIDPESLIFLDETGVNMKMARLYGLGTGRRAVPR